ncbi:YcfL family protein [Lonepinella sp. BR2474]|uniref:YcfL family protein n=1 Tax=Lonepinella sp. BR2474 TaxID=3434548 RepID=UPI003F6E2C0D
MKKILLICTALFLTACSSVPSLTYTHKPILNIAAELHPLIEASVTAQSAWVKNKSAQQINVQYDVFWYDQNGVTQPVSLQQDQYRATLLLAPEQQQAIHLSKPTPESVNYRLYLQLKQ